jgi:high affinity Mn2+ porin
MDMVKALKLLTLNLETGIFQLLLLISDQFMINKNIFFLITIFFVKTSFAQELIQNNSYINLHFQQTVITQGHPTFKVKYSGINSLNDEAETATSLTTTLFLGIRVYNNLQLYFDPEISGGAGISGAVGLAGFSNGETFRIGNPSPTLYPARLFVKYIFNIDKADMDSLNDDENQLKGLQSKKNFSIVIGKFSIADYFDNNEYSNDPRTQFLNWALMNSGAWDYPADTRGYTWGFAIMFNSPSWAIHFAAVMEPQSANGLDMDTHLNKAFGLVLEFDKNYFLFGKNGTARLLLFSNKARMGSYSETLNNTFYNMDITQTRRYSRLKYGFAFNLSQKINENFGGFLRASWNDGKTETWAFTEIDHSVAIGLVDKELFNSKFNNELGIAYLINGISNIHRKYLANGGHGFIIGDGKLNYGYENISEIYYKIQLTNFLFLTPDYQFVLNPAYNKDRGPVNIFSIRTHIEF